MVNPAPAPGAGAVATKSPPTGVNMSASRGGMPSFADFSLRHPGSPYNLSMSFGHGTFAAAAAAAAAISAPVNAISDHHTVTLAELFFNGRRFV